MIITSCKTEDDTGNLINSEFEQIKLILPQQQWKVDNLFINDAVHTDDFESFTFVFKEDGTVEGQNDLFTEMGTWVYKSSQENGEQLILKFGGTPPFDEISKDWEIVSLNNMKIELVIEENSNENTQLLAFSKL